MRQCEGLSWWDEPSVAQIGVHTHKIHIGAYIVYLRRGIAKPKAVALQDGEIGFGRLVS
jgi:hypothetical protein